MKDKKINYKRAASSQPTFFKKPIGKNKTKVKNSKTGRSPIRPFHFQEI
jgi:hypothetical protein